MSQHDSKDEAASPSKFDSKETSPSRFDSKESSPSKFDSQERSLPTIELTSGGDVDLAELKIDDDASQVPLAEALDPPSGQSLTSWTDVIRRQRAVQDSSRAGEVVQVDAPSDKDILDRLGQSDAKIGAKSDIKREVDTSEIPQAEMPVYAPYATPASESEIDLGRAAPLGPGMSGSEVGFEILFPPSDAGGAMPLPKLGDAQLSGIDFGAPLAAAAEGDDISFAAPAGGVELSGVDLGAAAPAVAEPGRSSILDVLLKSNEGPSHPGDQVSPVRAETIEPPVTPVRPTKPTVPTAGATAPRQGATSTQPGIDLSAPAGPPSDENYDLTDEDSEFGSADDSVDIYAQGGAAPSITDSGTLEVSEEAKAEAQRKTELQESSSIDLNSRPSVASSDFELELATPARLPGQINTDSDIDLQLPPLADDADSSIIRSKEKIDAEAHALAADLQSKRQPSPKTKAERPRATAAQVVPARESPKSNKWRDKLLHGGVPGLLVGAGGVLAAYFVGALPGRDKASTGTDNSAVVAQLRQESDAARKDAANARAGLDAFRKIVSAAGINPDQADRDLKAMQNSVSTSDARIKQLQADVTQFQTAVVSAQKAEREAKATAATATKNLGDAERAANDARRQLADASKVAETARAEVAAVKKDATTALAKAMFDAEAKEKEAALKLSEAAKKQTELALLVETTKKSADDATKARETTEATLKDVTDRLAKAKFIGEKPDVAAMLRGLDDAIKSASSDATVTLRDELAKARSRENKMSADLTAARVKETEATKLAATTRADVQKLSAEAIGAKADADRFKKELIASQIKADTAQSEAAAAKTNASNLSVELNRLKADNDRLARDLEVVRELADLIRSSNSTNSALPKVDPARLADRFFGDGLDDYYAGRYTEAQTAFRKAIQFRSDDARYYYLLGLSLWATNETAAAELAFEKGRDLEREARPTSRAVSAVLERIQGAPRRIVNSYRP